MSLLVVAEAAVWKVPGVQPVEEVAILWARPEREPVAAPLSVARAGTRGQVVSRSPLVPCAGS